MALHFELARFCRLVEIITLSALPEGLVGVWVLQRPHHLVHLDVCHCHVVPQRRVQHLPLVLGVRQAPDALLVLQLDNHLPGVVASRLRLLGGRWWGRCWSWWRLGDLHLLLFFFFICWFVCNILTIPVGGCLLESQSSCSPCQLCGVPPTSSCNRPSEIM